MRLFCLLFIPLVYVFRRTIGKSGRDSIWALPLGCVAALVQYFCGPLVTPEAFGFSRWMSGFVDSAVLPALVPLAVCGVLAALRLFPRDMDYAGFALLWLAPLAAVRSMTSAPSLIPLVLVPLLWVAQTVGISFFIRFIMRNTRWYAVISAVFGIAVLPLAAATSWWAFFAHYYGRGIMLLGVSLIPMAIAFYRELPAAAHHVFSFLEKK